MTRTEVDALIDELAQQGPHVDMATARAAARRIGCSVDGVLGMVAEARKSDGWTSYEREERFTLEQVQVILGERYEEFVMHLAAGVVPSTLALLTPGNVRPIVVTAGAVADWLHGDLPAATFPLAEDTAGRLLSHLEANVARWLEQDRIEAGVAADLGYYLTRVREAAEALQDRVDSIADYSG